MELLTRDEFRTEVFERSNGSCVVCGAPAADAHHIIERRLFPDGGYYLNNGAALCSQCHIKAEETTLSVEDIRERAGILKKVLPPHMYDDQPYDKWGNPILLNGTRCKGELFGDESVQKILSQGGVLGLFTEQVKYPRTHHLPWSPGMNDDDRVIGSLDRLESEEVVMTEKMDGENTSIYHDYIHARSIDGRDHASRHWVKNYWQGIRYDIPPGWRICGENLYAKHSIPYHTLPSYFLGFSVWDQKNRCLSWEDTQEWFALLGITSVPLLYKGPFSQAEIEKVWKTHCPDGMSKEGYVIRPSRSFDLPEFRHVVGKFVRKGHVQTTKHWMHGQPIEPNKLASLVLTDGGDPNR